MKHVIALSALVSFVGTASFACTYEERNALSSSISEVTESLVALDDANLGKVMAIKNAAAKAEYHSAQVGSMCIRQRQTLDALNEFAATQEIEQSAMLTPKDT